MTSSLRKESIPLNKITTLSSKAFIEGTQWSLSNTRVTIINDKVLLYLHHNLIAERQLNSSSISITTSGWNTLTTRRRLNGLPNVKTYTRKGQLFLNDEPWSGHWVDIFPNGSFIYVNHST